MARRPHIVIFNPDEWRGDVVGHLGNPAAHTPYLDEFVRTSAVSFRNAFCQNPVCTPSRCSFMSGWYPHVRGHRTMHHMLHPDEPVLLRTLKNNGYFVWWGGKNDLVPAQDGYAAYCDVRSPLPSGSGGRPTRPEAWRGKPGSDTFYSFYRGRIELPPGTTERHDNDYDQVHAAMDFIRHRPKDRPFCVYLALSAPHPPYGVEEPWFSLVSRDRLPPRIPPPASWDNKPSMLRGIWERQGLSGWSEDRWAELRATYYGMCARVDHLFGLLLQTLCEEGLEDDTALFFFSDHGDFAGDYGLVEKNQNTFEDCLTRVPLVVKPPRGWPVQPGVSNALVELVDVPATVEHFAGITPAHSHFGRSLVPLLAGATKHRDAVFCEGGRLRAEIHCSERESTAAQVPTGLYWPRVGLQSKNGPEHTKAVMCRTHRYKYVRRLDERDELYDLADDPSELDNRISDPSLAEVSATLRDRLLTFFLETVDVVPHTADRRE